MRAPSLSSVDCYSGNTSAVLSHPVSRGDQDSSKLCGVYHLERHDIQLLHDCHTRKKLTCYKEEVDVSQLIYNFFNLPVIPSRSASF